MRKICIRRIRALPLRKRFSFQPYLLKFPYMKIHIVSIRGEKISTDKSISYNAQKSIRK